MAGLSQGRVPIPLVINNKDIVAGNEINGKNFKPFLSKSGKVNYLQDLLSIRQYKELKTDKILAMNDKYVLVQVSENNTKKLIRLKYGTDLIALISQ